MRQKATAKWQEETLEKISKMSNVQLLEDYTWLAGGDDYDGCYTDRGQWEYDKLTEELHRRLKECNFLT